MKAKWKNTIILPDIHAPYHHRDTIPFVCAVATQIDAKTAYSVGDETDQHCISRWAANPAAHGPTAEFDKAKQFLHDLRDAHTVFKRMKLCHSNHGSRPFKQASRMSIPRSWVRTPCEAYQLPTWTWKRDWTIPWAQGTATIYHGTKKKGALNRAKQVGTSVIQGHWHSDFGLGWMRCDDSLRFGMDIGCLVDEDSPAFEYAEDSIFAQVLGCGAIVNGWPRLFSMELNKHKRWTGRIV